MFSNPKTPLECRRAHLAERMRRRDGVAVVVEALECLAPLPLQAFRQRLEYHRR